MEKMCIEFPVHAPKGDYVYKALIRRNEDFSWNIDQQTFLNTVDYKKSILDFNQVINFQISFVLLMIGFVIYKKFLKRNEQ